MKKWNIISTTSSDVYQTLLTNRGLINKEDIDDFLSPKLDRVDVDSVGIDTAQIKKAVKRIMQAIQKAELIVVYTDYDVDGICGGSILWEALHEKGARVMPYVPHRVDEGYGLSYKGIDAVLKQWPDVKLIITVDHGISAYEKVEYCKSKGIEVIVTDHHSLPQKVPLALAIIHTTKLSGSAVAWFLAGALEISKNNHERSLDLVALATIADLVPLLGANRTLVVYGLKHLNQTARIGLRALIDEAGLVSGEIGTYEISHILGPRINALGRLTHALDALRLLCTRSYERAQRLAQILTFTNKERQLLTEETILHARTFFQSLAEQQRLRTKLLFIDHETYNQGIIGLVAGKLVEEYYRPTIVVARGGTYSKASARSVSGFNILEAIRSAGDLLVECGGHPMAAGFTIETQKLPILQRRLEEIAQTTLTDDQLIRVVRIDCPLDLKSINWNFYSLLRQFEPFGLGNPEPVFAVCNLLVVKTRQVGKTGNHLKLKLRETAGEPLDAIAFGFGPWYQKLSEGVRIDAAYSLDVNSWQGNRTLQLRVKDLRLANGQKN